MKHTHRAHCQACGRIQALSKVSSGFIAKHGYKVTFGYFMGVCQGSDRLPLETNRELADATVVAVREYADKQEARVEALKAGKEFPLTASTGEMARTPSGGYKVVMVPFAEASKPQQDRAVAVMIAGVEANVRGLRSHADQIVKLIAEVHGKAPIAVVPESAKPVIDAGAVVKVHGKERTIVKVASRVCQGVGPGLNGQVLPHAFWANEKGDMFGYPIRLIRTIVKGA